MGRTRLWAAPLLFIFLTAQLGFCWKALDRSLDGAVDFRAFYTAGHMVTSGNGSRLYRYEEQARIQNAIVSRDRQTLPFLYPAFASLPFVPLSFLPYKTAFVTFTALNLCLLWISGLLIRKHTASLTALPIWLPAPLALCFFPVSIALMQGQITFLLLLVYSLCFVSLKTDRPIAAGLLLAVTVMKFQITLPVVLLLLLWRQTRVIAGFLAGAFVLALISLTITGVHGATDYPATLAKITADTILDPSSTRQKYGMSAADMPNLHGFFSFLTHGRGAGQALTLAVSILLIAWAARQQPSFGIALPAAMLVSYHLQAYDLTLLLLPIAIGARSKRLVAQRPVALYLGVLTLILPTAPFLLVQGLSCLFLGSIFAVLRANSYPGSDLQNPVEAHD